MKQIAWTFVIWSLLFQCLNEAAASPMAELSLQSQPGDQVGQGQTKDLIYTPTNSQFFSAQILPFLNVGGQPAFLRFLMGTSTGDLTTNTSSSLDFATNQLNIPMQSGHFADAERASFASPGHPGLDVSFQSSGCNTVTGNFTVNTVSFFRDSNNEQQIGSFDANFEQHCDGATPALFGRFVYQVASVPEPSSWFLVGSCLTVLTAVAWRQRHRK